jgi:hypothetical protein
LCLFVVGDRDDALSRLAMEWNDGQVSMTPRTFQDACGMEFHELLKGDSEKLWLDRCAQTCFVGEVVDELSGSDGQMVGILTGLWPLQKMNNSYWINLQSLEPPWMKPRGEPSGEHCPHALGLPSDACTGNLATQHRPR